MLYRGWRQFTTVDLQAYWNILCVIYVDNILLDWKENFLGAHEYIWSWFYEQWYWRMFLIESSYAESDTNVYFCR